ncbi:unnamed protein product [Alopecurus aequalis]
MLEDVRMRLLSCPTVSAVIETILGLPDNDKLLAVAFLWSCWNERNKGNHSERCLSIAEFQFTVRALVAEWEAHLKAKPRVSFRQPSLTAISSALHAEALALFNAVKIADGLGVGRVVFETDCLVLKNAIESPAYDFSPLGILFNELKFKLCMSFIEARIMHVQRFCNTPAHVLASMGAGVVGCEHSVWVSNYPDAVTRAVTSDFAVS